MVILPASISCTGHILPVSISYTGHILPVSISYTGHILPAFISYTGHILPGSISYTGHILPGFNQWAALATYSGIGSLIFTNSSLIALNAGKLWWKKHPMGIHLIVNCY